MWSRSHVVREAGGYRPPLLRAAATGWLDAVGRPAAKSAGDRRRPQESIFGNLCPARKHGPRSLKIAADGAPEGVSAAAVRSVKRIRRGTVPKARLSALRLPSSKGREPKAHPARQRGNDWSWLFDIQIRTSMRRSRLHGPRHRSTPSPHHHRRPCEGRDPYAVSLVIRAAIVTLGNWHSLTNNHWGYGSLLSQGRRQRCGADRIATKQNRPSVLRMSGSRSASGEGGAYA